MLSPGFKNSIICSKANPACSPAIASFPIAINSESLSKTAPVRAVDSIAGTGGPFCDGGFAIEASESKSLMLPSELLLLGRGLLLRLRHRLRFLDFHYHGFHLLEITRFITVFLSW